MKSNRKYKKNIVAVAVGVILGLMMLVTTGCDSANGNPSVAVLSGFQNFPLTRFLDLVYNHLGEDNKREDYFIKTLNTSTNVFPLIKNQP